MSDARELDIVIEGTTSAKRKWVFVALALGASALVLGFAAYYFGLGDDDISAVEQTIKEVPVVRGNLTDTLVTTGTAAARRQSDLFFPSGGQVLEVYVSLGDALEAGQALAQLSPTDALRAVEIAQTNLRVASLGLKRLTAPPTDAELESARSAVAQADSSLQQLIADSTDAARSSADASVNQAKSALETLMAPPTESDIAAAVLAVEQAKTTLEQLLNSPSPVADAERQLLSATRVVETTWAGLNLALTNYCDGTGKESMAFICKPGSVPLSNETVNQIGEVLVAWVNVPPAFTAGLSQLLLADANYKNALDQKTSSQTTLELSKSGRSTTSQGATDQKLSEARASLELAQARLDFLYETPPLHEINKAKSSLKSALEARASLDEPPSNYDLVRAETALRSAQANLAALINGASGVDIDAEKQQVRLKEIALEQAKDQLNNLTLRSPYKGTVASIAIVPGDQVTASHPAFVVTDLASVGVDITVSESDLIGLAPGQLGVAQFDSLENQTYLLQVTGIETNPTVTQGVVTYTIQAKMADSTTLAGREAELRELQSLNSPGGSTSGLGFAGADTSSTQDFGNRSRAGRSAGSGMRGSRGGAFLECIQKVLGRTPQGQGDISESDRGRIQKECGSNARGSGAGNEGSAPRRANENPTTPERLSNAPTTGMNASVTVLLSIKADVLLVPTEAVRQQGNESFVYVPSGDGQVEQKDVSVGGTDGALTEILLGLSEGDIVLTGAGLTKFQTPNPNLRARGNLR